MPKAKSPTSLTIFVTCGTVQILIVVSCASPLHSALTCPLCFAAFPTAMFLY